MPLNIGLGFGIGTRMPSSGGGTQVPLQIVGTRGEINLLTTTTGLRQTGRHRAFTGGAALKTIAVADANWTVSATAETNGAAQFTLQRAIEFNGVSVPVTWSGVNSVTLQPGDTVFSDEIPASAFGLSDIPANSTLWMRAERTRPSSTSMVVHGTSSYPTSISGEALVHRSTADATQVFNTGALTTAGGWTSTFGAVQYLPLAILGRPKTPLMALFIVGASKEYGQSDSTGDGNNDGGGYVRRAVQSVSGDHIPYVNCAVTGEAATSFINNSTKRRVLLPYCTHVICGHGGNDYSTGVSISNAISRITTEWGLLSATGAEVHMILEMPKTDSTDSWSTTVNQTPRTGYETGGAWRDAFNAHINDSNGSLIQGVIDLNPSVADGTALDKWAASSTTDGTHPIKARHASQLSTALASYLEDLKTAYEGL